jgi:hypothetical protein
LIVAALALVPASTASAATLYSNLAGGGGDSSGTGETDSTAWWIAQPFVPTTSGTARLVGFYGVSLINAPATVSVSIYSNNGGQPGTALATGAQTVIGDSSTSVPTCTALSGIGGGALPVLSTTQTYWAVFQTYHNAALWSTASQGGLAPKFSGNSGASWGAPPQPWTARSVLVDDGQSCNADIDTIPVAGGNLDDMYAHAGGTSFQTLSAHNSGNAELKLTGGSFSGPNAGIFKLLDGEPDGRPPGAPITWSIAHPKTLGTGPGVVLMYITCAPPPGTPDGLYTATFTLTSNDPDEGSLQWPVICILDSTPPSLEFIQNPDGRNGWFVTNPAPLQIRGIDPESGNRVKHIFCSDSAGVALDWPNGSFAQFAIQPEGVHALSCQGTDVANNTSVPGANNTTVKIDTTAPETTPGDVGPPAIADVTGSDFSFGGSDATSGVQEFECSLDGGPYELCTSPAHRGGLGNSTHTFDVRARDGAGNYDPTPVRWTWEVNAPAPQATDDAATATRGIPLDIDVLANDLAPSGEPLTILLGSDTSEEGGAISVAGSKVQYVAPPGFAGADRFSYRAVNGQGVMSEAATVTVQVAARSGPGVDSGACDKAKKKLAKAKKKLRKLKQHDASKQAIDKAKAKVKKRRHAVKAACGSPS